MTVSLIIRSLAHGNHKVGERLDGCVGVYAELLNAMGRPNRCVDVSGGTVYTWWHYDLTFELFMR